MNTPITMHEAYSNFQAAAEQHRAKLAEAKIARDKAIREANEQYKKLAAECDAACKAEYAKFREIQEEFRSGRKAARDAREAAAAAKAAEKAAAAEPTALEPVAEVTETAPETKSSKKRSAKKVEATTEA